MTSHSDLSAGTSGALGTYRTVTAVPIVNKTETETVNVFQPKPERDIIDDIGRSADAFRKVSKAFQDFNPFSHIPFLPIGGMGQNNPGAGEFPEPFPEPYEPPIIPEIPMIPI